MKIIKAGFSKTFPLNQFYEKVWLEAELNDGDNERNCLYELKRKAEDFFYESKAAAEKQMGVKEDVVEQLPPPTLSKVAAIIQQISSVTELKVLESYKLIAKGDADIQEAYDKKLNELQP